MASMKRCAERGLPLFLNAVQDREDLKNRDEQYRALLRLSNQQVDPSYVLNRFIFVGETTEEAREAMREPFMRFIRAHAPDLKAALERTYGLKSEVGSAAKLRAHMWGTVVRSGGRTLTCGVGGIVL